MVEQIEPLKALGTILIVEDDQGLRAALARLLQIEGYGIQMASRISEAAEYISQGQPSAAIIDLHLPDGSGLNLVKALRGRFGSSLPIVILSGDGELDTLRGLAEQGVTHYLHKPVAAPVLMKCLSALLKLEGHN